MLTPIQLNNLQTAAQESIKCEQATGIPCELILAQWAEESGWGLHSPNNNCFGIKEYPGCDGHQLLTTYEYFTDKELANWLNHVDGRTAEKVPGIYKDRQKYRVKDWFATFNTLSNCFIKRASLFNLGHYAGYSQQYKQDKNLVALVQGIGPLYATDPNYATEVLRIASMPEVMGAIQLVRGA